MYTAPGKFFISGESLIQHLRQIATTTRYVTDGRESWIVFFITIVIGLSAAFFLYSIDRFSLIYYGDSVSHLVRAREFVDSINPGLFEQLGTAWLPLPHLLLLPFTLVEPLFRTGFAGTALSLSCLAITSVFLYEIIKSHLNVGYVAIAGALLYATNPNILYMGITPMTESPFMLFFVGSAYFFIKWMSGPGKRLSLNSNNKGKNSGIAALPAKRSGPGRYGKISHASLDLIMCSIFVSLATLCRYEGWVLSLFFVPVVAITVIKNKDCYYSRKYKIGIILVSTLSLSGIALWLIWNAYAYNDPLEFTNAPYFSAAAQALEGPNRVFLYLQPWNVVLLYGIATFAMYGPVLLVTALLGYRVHKHLGKADERRRRRNLYLFLAIPPLFTAASLLIGIGEMNLSEWFNSRFIIFLAPLIISLACILISKLPIHLKKNRLIFAGMILIFFAYQTATPALGVVTFLNANDQFSGSRPFQVKMSEALSSAYDGKSMILIIAGSSQQNEIMQASGVPLRQFDPILESESNKDSFKKPWKYATYIVLAKKPDPSAKNVAYYWLDRLELLNKHYNTIYEDKYYWVKKLS